MAALLVSVRDADEAVAAFSAGAAVIDVKEPSRGPLGRADVATWRKVRRALPDRAILSVALGEWNEPCEDALDPAAFLGVSFRKVGLAGLNTPTRSLEDFDRFRSRFHDPTPWVYVIYADGERASAADPDRVVEAALNTSKTTCAGILIDTWDKRQDSPIERDVRAWSARVRRIQASGRFAALAGRLDEGAIERLGRSIAPDLFAVRGAACERGDRRNAIEPARVASLVATASACASRRDDRLALFKTVAPTYATT